MADVTCHKCASIYNGEFFDSCPTCEASGSVSELDEAKSLETSPERLMELASHPSHRVRRSAVANPKAPAEVHQLLEERQAEEARRQSRASLVVTTESIPGYDIERAFGLVFAAQSHTKWKGLSQYQRLLKALESSIPQLLDQARALGGDSVVGVKMAANSSSGNSSGLDVGSSDGVILLGTAVRAVPKARRPIVHCTQCREDIDAQAAKCWRCGTERTPVA